MLMPLTPLLDSNIFYSEQTCLLKFCHCTDANDFSKNVPFL